jgi:hypothetical protein
MRPRSPACSRSRSANGTGLRSASAPADMAALVAGIATTRTTGARPGDLLSMATNTNRRRDVPGTIYLLHFDTPYRHAKHYLGTPASSGFLKG